MIILYLNRNKLNFLEIIYHGYLSHRFLERFSILSESFQLFIRYFAWNSFRRTLIERCMCGIVRLVCDELKIKMLSNSSDIYYIPSNKNFFNFFRSDGNENIFFFKVLDDLSLFFRLLLVFFIRYFWFGNSVWTRKRKFCDWAFC